MGSGAFSNVYKVGNGQFLKISRAASLEKSLGEELKILKVLEQRTMGSHDIRGYYVTMCARTHHRHAFTFTIHPKYHIQYYYTYTIRIAAISFLSSSELIHSSFVTCAL